MATARACGAASDLGRSPSLFSFAFTPVRLCYNAPPTLGEPGADPARERGGVRGADHLVGVRSGLPHHWLRALHRHQQRCVCARLLQYACLRSSRGMRQGLGLCVLLVSSFGMRCSTPMLLGSSDRVQYCCCVHVASFPYCEICGE